MSKNITTSTTNDAQSEKKCGGGILLILLAYHSTQQLVGTFFAGLAQGTFARKLLQHFSCIMNSACLIEDSAQSLHSPLCFSLIAAETNER